MQGVRPKKKKKYVMASNSTKATNSFSANSRLLQEDRAEGRALERCRFDYSFEEIVNHLLAKLLPNSNYTIKLSEKLIFGEQKELDNFVNRLDENIKYTAGMTIELKEGITKEDIEYKMLQHYRGKTFNSILIEMSVKHF